MRSLQLPLYGFTPWCQQGTETSGTGTLSRGSGIPFYRKNPKISHVAVYNWIREFGEKLEELKSSKEIKVVEIDEMRSYISNKKTTAGYGFLLIDIGENSSIALLASRIRPLENYL